MPESDQSSETSAPQRPTDAEATAPSGPAARPPADPHAGSASSAPSLEATVPPSAFGQHTVGGLEPTLPLPPSRSVAGPGAAPPAGATAFTQWSGPGSAAPASASGGPASESAEPQPGLPEPSVGSMLGRYRLVRELGRGAMGVVFEAEDTALHRRVAVKVLTEQWARESEALRRFRREARSAGRLRHPNAVAVLDIGQEGPAHFLVMELIAGGSLLEVLRAGGPLPWRQAVRVAADVTRAVAAAHAAGLIHRDIKPGNILLDSGTGSPPDLGTAVVKLADFGLVKAFDQAGSVLTKTGTPLGTPAYMSPEQCRGDAADARCDIYALGATLFALLTGHPPFAGKIAEVMAGHCYAPVPDPRAERPDIPAPVSAVIARAMAKSPDRRHQTADELLADLQAAAGGSLTATEPRPACEPAPAAPEAGPTTETAVGSATEARTARPTVRWMWPAAVAAAVVAAPLGLWWALGRPADPAGKPAPPTRVPDPTPPTVMGTAMGPSPTPPPEPADVVAELSARAAAASDPAERRAIWRRLADRHHRLAAAGRTAEADHAAGAAARIAEPAFAPDHVLRSSASLRRIAFSPDSARLAGGELKTGRVRVWNLADRTEAFVRDAHRGNVPAVAFSARGLLAAGGADGRITVWSADGTRLWEKKVSGTVESIAFSPDGNLLAAGDADAVTLWTADGAAAGSWAAPARAYSLVFGPDSRRLIVGRLDGGVSVLAAPDWSPVGRPLKAHAVAGVTLAVSADGRRMISVSTAEGTARLWAVPDPDRPTELIGHGDGLLAAAMSPDGRLAATAGRDAMLRLWDAGSRRSLGAVPLPGKVYSLAVSPDGRTLAAALWTSEVLLWSLPAE